MKELTMLNAYLKNRIAYFIKKQGDNTYYDDTISELKSVQAMTSSVLDIENEDDKIPKVLDLIHGIDVKD